MSRIAVTTPFRACQPQFIGTPGLRWLSICQRFELLHNDKVANSRKQRIIDANERNVGDDVYTEPSHVDPDTLANLGPLRPLAGVWESDTGDDEHPVAEGTQHNRYVEHIELQPIDPQTNGPQLFYGLRYHTHIVKPGEVETFHDQVGYWLWEPVTNSVILMFAIPRAQVAMAGGTAKPDAVEFELYADRGSTSFGICSGPFLDRQFRTSQVRIRVRILPDGRWSYDEVTTLMIAGRTEPFLHRDRNTLSRIAEPTPNPLAR
jgi:hypothetical protein